MAEDSSARFKLRKTRWSWQDKPFLQSVVTVGTDEVLVGEEGTVRSSIDGGGSKHTFDEFLKGEQQWFIQDPAVLAEVIASVRMLLPDDPPSEKMPEIQRRLETLQKIPIDPELAGLNRRGSLEDGSRNYHQQRSFIKWLNGPNGVLYRIPVDECLIDHRPRAFLRHNDEVHFVIDQTFAVSDRSGKWIQPPEETGAIFGDCLLIDNVYRCNDIVFYSYFWMYRKFPDGLLRYEKGKGFTGRFEANPSWKTVCSFAAKDWSRDLKPAGHKRLSLSSPVFSLRGAFKPRRCRASWFRILLPRKESDVIEPRAGADRFGNKIGPCQTDWIRQKAGLGDCRAREVRLPEPGWKRPGAGDRSFHRPVGFKNRKAASEMDRPQRSRTMRFIFTGRRAAGIFRRR